MLGCCVFKNSKNLSASDSQLKRHIISSTYRLYKIILKLLKYGLKHPVHPLQVNKMDILTKFDFVHRAMTKDLRDEKQSGEVKTKISNLAHSYVNSYKPTLHTLKKHRILKRLTRNKDIVR